MRRIMIPPALAKLSQAGSFMLISHSQGDTQNGNSIRNDHKRGNPLHQALRGRRSPRDPRHQPGRERPQSGHIQDRIPRLHRLSRRQTGAHDGDRTEGRSEAQEHSGMRRHQHSDQQRTCSRSGDTASAHTCHPPLHIHVIPRYKDDGQTFGFEKTKYADGEIAQYGARLAL